MPNFFGSKKNTPPLNAAGATRIQELGGLRVFEESDGPTPSSPQTNVVDNKSVTFRGVATCIHLALSILETQQGTSATTAIGQAVISKRANFEHIYDDKPENMSWWVGLFLARLRASFPPVILTNHMGGEGQTSRANWGQGGVRMRQWDPKSAGTLKLNKHILQNMIRAGHAVTQNLQPRDAHLEAYEKFMFLMAVTVAHELIHFFVGYLTGYDRPSTPGEVSFLPNLYNSTSSDGSPIGESGRVWESIVLGGIIDTFENKRNPLGSYQAGDFYIIDKQQKARMLDHACVRKILASDYTFPLITKGPELPLQTLDYACRTMKQVRTATLSGGRIASPARSCSGPTTINRDRMKGFASVPSHTVCGQEFTLVRWATREPGYLFAAV